MATLPASRGPRLAVDMSRVPENRVFRLEMVHASNLQRRRVETSFDARFDTQRTYRFHAAGAGVINPTSAPCGSEIIAILPICASCVGAMIVLAPFVAAKSTASSKSSTWK